MVRTSGAVRSCRYGAVIGVARCRPDRVRPVNCVFRLDNFLMLLRFICWNLD